MSRLLGRGGREAITVAFMGLDGTGKSTQAEALEAEAAARGRRPVRVHLASTKVPGLRELKQRYHAEAVRILRHRRARSERGGKDAPLAGGGALAWVLSMYLLSGSFIKSVWYRWRFRGGMIIFDRCLLDDVVKVRWRLGTETRLSGILMRVAPKPKVVVVLEGDPRQTFGRKKAANCTYDEYLQKGRFLDLTLQEAVGLGWVFERVGIDGRSRDEVFRQVCRVLEAHAFVPGGRGPKEATGSGRPE